MFVRLPSESIARFHYLSKQWASTLGRQDFTDMFLKNSTSHPRLLFTVQVNGKLFFFSSPQARSPEADSSLVATRYRTFSLERYRHGICPPTRGWLCYRGREKEDTPVICNPATGEILALPKTNWTFARTYFGYDPMDKVFKVLCISAKSVQHQVLTVDTRRIIRWRWIVCKRHDPWLYGHGICIDGVLYYCARVHKESVLVCFDVTSEKFSFINIDDGSMTLDSTLINYKGKLGLVQFKDSDQRSLCLWLLEDAEKHEFSKHICEFPLWWQDMDSRCSYDIVGTTAGTCDIVLSPCSLQDRLYVFYYNVERKTLVRIEIQGHGLKLTNSVLHTFQDYVEDVKLIMESPQGLVNSVLESVVNC
ncbi:unnamed protein product [Microthlaspi erraticum]|uniref:F-box associated beta-propeller type 3 domain-containing protein n=1 Tax=Microthlaspi erraticum TaxID=1685480 RepID=A0A6D2K3G6_9BRAS|nr:unnamed protein product [Microthlaspi erraticum]